MKPALFPTSFRPGRPGFTLVELLVVLAILVILVALTAGATLNVITTQRQRNSELTIQKLGGVLDGQWKAVIQDAASEVIPDSVTTNLANGDPVRARVIWTKFRLMQEFPMSYAEIFQPTAQNYGIGQRSSYVRALQQAN